MNEIKTHPTPNEEVTKPLNNHRNNSTNKMNLQIQIDPHSLLRLSLHEIDLESLHGQLDSPHKIATARMLSLGVSPQQGETQRLDHTIEPIQGGLGFCLVQILSQSVQEWSQFLLNSHSSTHRQSPKPQEEEEEKKEDDEQLLVSNECPCPSRPSSIVRCIETKRLRQVLSLHLHVSKADHTLAEEMARGCGSHRELSKLIRMDVYSILSAMESSMTRQEYEAEEDVLVELQDLAAELAHCDPSISYPAKIFPFQVEELQSRLPLLFNVTSPDGRQECLRVRQVTDRQSAQEDVGFVMWPSAVVLASWLLDHEELIFGKNVLEIGAGCGLTGLVAARIAAGAVSMSTSTSTHSKIILSDFNRKVLMNIDRNIALNDLGDVAEPTHLDFYLQNGKHTKGGWKGTDFESFLAGEDKGLAVGQPPVDLILAADTICKPEDSVAVSNTIHDALRPGGEAIVVSANAQHRFGIDIFERECERNGLQVTIHNVADMCEGKLLPKDLDSEDPCSIRQTSGFVDGMTLTMFRVRKPL